MPGTPRNAQDREESARLLPSTNGYTDSTSPEDAHVAESQGSGIGSWFQRALRRDTAVRSEEEDRLLPAYYTSKPKTRVWVQWVVYLGLLVIGGIIGLVISMTSARTSTSNNGLPDEPHFQYLPPVSWFRSRVLRDGVMLTRRVLLALLSPTQ